MFIIMWIPMLVCVSGAIWMPIVGLIIGGTMVQNTEKLQNVNPMIGGVIGAIISFAFWLVFIWPNLNYLIPSL